MLILLRDKVPDGRLAPDLVNGNLYIKTNEIAGILPIPKSIQDKVGLQSYDPQLHSKQLHAFLAMKQGTRKPVMPIHASAEHKLFRQLLPKVLAEVKGDFSSEKDWETFVRAWNQHANESPQITYKVSYKYCQNNLSN